MHRRALILVVVGAALGALGWWLTSNFGLTTHRVYVGYSGEARHNQYYAAALLLERMGKQVTRQAALNSVNQVPDGVTIFLPFVYLNTHTVEALLAWAERGGHLVFSVDYTGNDSLLKVLGVRAVTPERRTQPGPGPTPPERVLLPDGRALHVHLSGSPVLVDEGPAAQWRTTGPEGDRVLAISHGNGRITVVSTSTPFNNYFLERADNAALLWYLFQDEGPRVIIVSRLSSVSLLAWLRDHATSVLAALAALIALWLWRVVPRFGPLQAPSVAQRRSLLEHLRAVGRFLADARQLGPLLQLVRADAQAEFQRAAPMSAALDGPGRLREASRLTGLRPRELMQAFAGSAATRHEFFNAVRTLAAFRRRLARRSARDEQR
jgi:hypothetical protein